MEFPNEAKTWFIDSNTVVVLAAKDLKELEEFGSMLDKIGYKHSKFKEPDIGDELTSIALVPSLEAKRLCSKFKLAGK